NKGVTPSGDVKDFYRDDLMFAVDNLPVSWPSPSDLGRATVGSAIAVLGKSFLYDGDYATAETYFRFIVDELNYSLTEDIGDNFSTDSEFNSESILEINYSSDLKTDENVFSETVLSHRLSSAFAPVSAGGFRSIYPACWLIVEYQNDAPDPSDPDNMVLARDNNGNVLRTANDMEDSVHLRRFSERTSKSIALINDVDEPYYGQLAAAAGSFVNGETAYWRKNTNSATLTSENDNPSFDRSGSNINVIRLADVYLMLAECLIQGGTNDAGVDEALVFINRVRRRSKVVLLGLNGSGEFPTSTHDNLTYSADQLMDHLMFVERPLELSAEGHAIRFLDLRRWGITKERFEELAPTLYTADEYQFNSPLDGSLVRRFNAVLREVSTEAEAKNFFLNSRQGPAMNYNDDLHSYWSLPEGEVANNGGINTEG
ncbi:MAG: RagB/SusD family nutrient uptake outer membrane protein, partial [Bacteroidota bacterium]